MQGNIKKVAVEGRSRSRFLMQEGREEGVHYAEHERSLWTETEKSLNIPLVSGQEACRSVSDADVRSVND